MKSQLEKYTPQGPKGSWLSGNLMAYRKDPLQFLTDLQRDYGGVAKIRLGPQQMYVLYDSELLKELLITKQEHFVKLKAFQEARLFVGDGVATSTGEKHKRVRRLIQPHFTRAHIQTYAGQMADIVEGELNRWETGQRRSLTDDISNITFAIIAKTLFSLEGDEYARAIREPYETINRMCAERMRQLAAMPLFVPTAKNRAYKDSLQSLDRAVYAILKERKLNPAIGEGDLLSVLIAAKDENGRGMTDQELRDELMIMFIAGHETSANALSWAFSFILRQPEVEQKLYEEWDRVLQGARPTAENYMQLTYTQNVIWEAMRLRAPTFFTGRSAIRDVELGPLRVKKGQSVLFSPFAIHQNPAYFPDPQAFLPERFENDLLKRIPQFAYMPFGGGPRGCIGNHFAMLEMVIVLTMIGQRYRIRLTPGHPPIEMEPLLTLRPKNGIEIVVDRANG
ncbi:cytochrome P450 [Paenibacillus methanolicus]|uniref:Cytochrome P450 n=1 Tax=Paenibacillus methanolicus TaxID=582686 RepID=A0A5S5CJS4_9BACL|nr:cytochrome P450 [Paenibacillus methanolicus]TYP79157.1 cytochrome P450 [Paenibacillus methanolicus]